MKSKLNLLFIVALAFCAYNCSHKGDSSVSEVIVDGNKMYVFSLNDLKSDTTILSLSSFVEDCILVHLETSEDAYFKPQTTTVTEKYIGIRQSQAPYKLFDRSGKFLCNVGGIGNGPGEYSYTPYDDIIDDENGLIYLAPFAFNEKIGVYNTSGTFLKYIYAPERLNKPKIYLSGDILTVVHLPFEGAKSLVYQFNVNTGELLKELALPIHLAMQPNFDNEMLSTRNMSNYIDFQFFNIFESNDTLYHYDAANNKTLPLFTITYGPSENIYFQYIILNKDLFISNVRCMTWIGSCTKTGIVATDLKNKTASWIKVVNDYYGNLPVAPKFHNGYFVHNVQPEELMEDIENRLTAKNCTESDRQLLKKTLSSLKEGANNVVFIGKLKNEINAKL